MSSLIWICGFNGMIGCIVLCWMVECMCWVFMMFGEWLLKDWELLLLVSLECVILCFGLLVLCWGEGLVVLLLYGWVGRLI